MRGLDDVSSAVDSFSSVAGSIFLFISFIMVSLGICKLYCSVKSGESPDGIVLLTGIIMLGFSLGFMGSKEFDIINVFYYVGYTILFVISLSLLVYLNTLLLNLNKYRKYKSKTNLFLQLKNDFNTVMINIELLDEQVERNKDFIKSGPSFLVERINLLNDLLLQKQYQYKNIITTYKKEFSESLI